MLSQLRNVLHQIPKPSPAMLVGLLALGVAGTGTAVAATGQVVNIADGTTASRVAHVDATGRLYVSDGGGSLTVDGTVSTRPSLPAKPWSKYTTSTGAKLRGPRTSAFALSSLTMTNSGTTTGTVSLYQGYACANATGNGILAKFLVPAGQTITVPYPSPLVVAAITNCTVHLYASWTGGTLSVSGVGFDS